MASVDLEPLISSLGEASSDAFYFACACTPVERVRDLLRREPSQDHLDLGLKAAFLSQRADVAKLVLDRGANVEPLLAFIGLEEAQVFISKGEHSLRSQNIDSPPLALRSPNKSEREHNNLRLQWAQLKPRNSTVSAIVEGIDGQRPTATHLQASHTSFSSAHRVAWMQFDLERSGNKHLNRIADIVNIQGTPLHWAVDDHNCPSENHEVFDFLLKRGADPTIKSRCGSTPREECLEQLKLPEDALLPKFREFYLYAAEQLEEAERKFARSPSTGLFSKAKFVFGWN